MLKGRLGLETARIPQADRHGLLWLTRGRLFVEDGTLHFSTAGGGELPPGQYCLPFQTFSNFLLGPGTTISHDALRLLARHKTGLYAVGEDGVRLYASLPAQPNDSAIARAHARRWADEEQRLLIARTMYAWRLGEVFPDSQIEVLRGIEGARMKEIYKRTAEAYGIKWRGRRYDRSNPTAADIPNQAINHAATAVEAAAELAVTLVGAIPQLGFIHEDSGNAFTLDIADLFRDSITLPIAFAAAREAERRGDWNIDRLVRQIGGKLLREKKVIPSMIDRIKELFDGGRRHS